ncbi:hypothetical protein CYR55_18610 [Chimaeribacter californicus]|uniref:Uncharacterized protein n=1 Tax=Chimaeribacter californicus TaxID=2060067 RepID=A0A2N5DYE2_9GAMM|nr:hypothetical protein [Chimaeribacter californicus]PLR32593.1 hypothetical protein CYR55_18610 [Chimaeribacter californicus]
MITKSELNEFNQAIFTGITVGIGSLVFLFSTGASILVQCSFQCGNTDEFLIGHGEDLMTSNLLFSFLNQCVKQVEVLEGDIFKLVFCNGNEIDIIPDANGFESYVVTTSQGIYPVISY